MKRIINILALPLFGILIADRTPENGDSLNHTQLFFKWKQIPRIVNYDFFIQDVNTEESLIFRIESNSLLLTEFLSWDSYYTWFICGNFENESEPICIENYNFSINPIPDYFPDTINILQYDQSNTQEGITMMDFESLNFSSALDKSGSPLLVIRKEDFPQFFTFTQFLDNGNLLGFGPGTGYEINLDGNIVFETPDNISLHHDFNKTSKGTYFLISATIQNQYCPEECNSSLPDEIPWQGDIFRELDKDGNELWSWNTFDYFDLTEYNPYYVEIFNGWNQMDWTHSNSVFYDENSEAVIVSIRNLSRITKIDYSSKELIWNMGNPEYMNELYFEEDHNFSQQHSTQVLENGNLLFFDNHRYLSPELSRCVEIAYNEIEQTSEIIWEHILPAEFFTGSRGECDRLKNGNTLITAGRSGNTIEVTPNNEIVWHLEVKNSNLPVTTYRSSRIQNLFPIAFSFSIDEMIENSVHPIVEPNNGSINLHIYNHGWSKGWYIHTINDHIDSTYLYPFENSNIHFNLDELGINEESNFLLEVYPSFAPGKLQTLGFSLPSSNILGDMNEDGMLNILDIVTLANLVLEGNMSDTNGDLNQDGTQNVLDIILLVNIILEN